jgi:hypothetical protein
MGPTRVQQFCWSPPTAEPVHPAHAPSRPDALRRYAEAGSPFGRSARAFFIWLSFGATARLN